MCHMNDLMQWEIDWINSNPSGYDGPMHQRAVIENIKKRYAMKSLCLKVSEILETKEFAVKA